MAEEERPKLIPLVHGRPRKDVEDTLFLGGVDLGVGINGLSIGLIKTVGRLAECLGHAAAVDPAVATALARIKEKEIREEAAGG